jgi:hypothetical protein
VSLNDLVKELRSLSEPDPIVAAQTIIDQLGYEDVRDLLQLRAVRAAFLKEAQKIVNAKGVIASTVVSSWEGNLKPLVMEFTWLALRHAGHLGISQEHALQLHQLRGAVTPRAALELMSPAFIVVSDRSLISDDLFPLLRWPSLLDYIARAAAEKTTD